MLRKLLAFVLSIGVLATFIGCGTGCSPGITSCSGKAETRNLNLSGFTSIQASHAFSVQVTQKDSFNLQVTADDNMWDSLDIKVSGNVLHLGVKPGVRLTDSRLRADIMLPDITGLDLSGMSTATINGFSSDSDMAFTLSDGSTADISNMKTGAVTLNISGLSSLTGSIIITNGKFVASGGSKVDLSGSGNNLSLDLSGISQVTMDQFKTKSVSVILSEGSTAKVNSENITSADLSGLSNLFYVDNPTLGKIQTSGGSNIHHE